jgi:hypothetical protein
MDTCNRQQFALHLLFRSVKDHIDYLLTTGSPTRYGGTLACPCYPCTLTNIVNSDENAVLNKTVLDSLSGLLLTMYASASPSKPTNLAEYKLGIIRR